jgi:hypothetical protein
MGQKFIIFLQLLSQNEPSQVQVFKDSLDAFVVRKCTKCLQCGFEHVKMAILTLKIWKR